jgi:hypothetical protein
MVATLELNLKRFKNRHHFHSPALLLADLTYK